MHSKSVGVNPATGEATDESDKQYSLDSSTILYIIGGLDWKCLLVLKAYPPIKTSLYI